jgi:hypothetical protein
MNISIKTVETQMTRALKQLRVEVLWAIISLPTHAEICS